MGRGRLGVGMGSVLFDCWIVYANNENHNDAAAIIKVVCVSIDVTDS